MKKNEKNLKKVNFSSVKFTEFIKNNLILIIAIIISLTIIALLSFVLIKGQINKMCCRRNFKKYENISNSNILVDKVVCYSSATGTNNKTNQAIWNLDLSQYTDIAIYINSKVPINEMYIDNIAFEDSKSGTNLSLNYLQTEDYAKLIDMQNINIETVDKIPLPLSSPITLRYMNYKLAKSKTITNIQSPIYYDGSLLKNAKIPLSTLKNNVSFILHIKTADNEDLSYNFNIPIILKSKENKENNIQNENNITLEENKTNHSIYDGYYINEIPYTNAYFY